MLDRTGCRSCLDLNECMEYGKPRDPRAVLVGCTKSSKLFHGSGSKNEWIKRETIKTKESREKSRNKGKKRGKVRRKNIKTNDKNGVASK